MRSEATRTEQRIAKALKRSFQKEGYTVHFPQRKVKDKPDILVEIGGTLVAGECTQIPPSKIYYHHKKKPQESDWNGCNLKSTIWANEPHMWLASAIKAKSRLVPNYLTRTSAKEAWLLIHSPPQSKQFFIQSHKKWITYALRHSANIHEHPFSQVLLWTPQEGLMTLFSRASGDPMLTGFDVNFKDGYPTCTVVQSTVGFKTTQSLHSPPRELHETYNTTNSIIIEPDDPVFAEHSPATREANYDFFIQSWSNRAEIQWRVSFVDTKETIDLESTKLNGLKPNTNYYMHYIHEYCAPKRLQTYHKC